MRLFKMDARSFSSFFFFHLGGFANPKNQTPVPVNLKPRKFESHQVHFTVSDMTAFHTTQICRKYPIGSRGRAADARQKWTLGSYFFFTHRLTFNKHKKSFLVSPLYYGQHGV